VRRSVKEIAIRRLALVEALRRLPDAHIEIGTHQAGMHMVVWFRSLGFDRFPKFVEYARSLGLGLHPVHCYYQNLPSRPGLLIGYAGLSVSQLQSAIELFGRCLAREHSVRKLQAHAVDLTQTTVE
jgi:GntR family transcriptional regulator / MocR family aminotransferase